MQINTKIKSFLEQFSKEVNEKEIKERVETTILKTIKKDELVGFLKLAVSSIDLTTLEGNDTKEKVTNLCIKAVKPSETYVDIPSCAAVCVYPNFVRLVSDRLEGTTVRVASVAAGFPSGQYPLETKLEEVKYCIRNGADEIDIVILRGEFLEGNYNSVFDEISKIKEVCKNASNIIRDNQIEKKNVQLKVILETGELVSLDKIRKAGLISILAGADFIKTSTGKIQLAATLPAMLVMIDTIKDYYYETGNKIGIKPAGGIKTVNDATNYIMLVKDILGDEWLTPALFRIGASSLLDNLLNKYSDINEG